MPPWTGYLTTLQRYTPIAFIIFIVQSFFRHQNSRAAFYLAFTSLFAVVPMMTVIYSVLSLIPELKGLEGKMQTFMFEHFVPSTGTQLESYLQSFAQQAANLTSVGVGMLFVTSVLMLKKIEDSFNTIWHVSEGRKGVNGFLLYWALLSLGPVMMGGAFAVSTYLASLKMIYDFVPLPGIQTVVLSILPVLMSSLAFSLAYLAIPNTRVPIAHGVLGGIVAAILFDLARRAMTIFITLSPSYELIYGAFAAVPIFLIWILVSWNILLIGAEFVQALTNFRSSRRAAASSLGRMLAILERIYRAHGKGVVLIENELEENMAWITPEEWEVYLLKLEEMGLIKRGAEGELTLRRDLHKYTLADLFRDCYDSAISLDMDVDVPWGKHLVALYNSGITRCLEAWDVNLAELFEHRPERVARPDESTA